MRDWVDILVNWFPMLLLIAVWVLCLFWMRRSGGFQGRYQTQYLEQIRAHTAALERIAAALERRSTD